MIGIIWNRVTSVHESVRAYMGLQWMIECPVKYSVKICYHCMKIMIGVLCQIGTFSDPDDTAHSSECPTEVEYIWMRTVDNSSWHLLCSYNVLSIDLGIQFRMSPLRFDDTNWSKVELVYPHCKGYRTRSAGNSSMATIGFHMRHTIFQCVFMVFENQ